MLTPRFSYQLVTSYVVFLQFIISLLLCGIVTRPTRPIEGDSQLDAIIYRSIFENDNDITAGHDTFPIPKWSASACDGFVSDPIRSNECWMVAWHVTDHAVGRVFDSEPEAVEFYKSKFGGPWASDNTARPPHLPTTMCSGTLMGVSPLSSQ